jgi:hypothetical protein
VPSPRTWLRRGGICLRCKEFSRSRATAHRVITDPELAPGHLKESPPEPPEVVGRGGVFALKTPEVSPGAGGAMADLATQLEPLPLRGASLCGSTWHAWEVLCGL